MDNTTQIVQNYYDENVQSEWNRIEGRPEFILTCRYMDRYIKPGDSVLDIGGGPGRYSIYLAQRGCNVTLMDLSIKNVEFAAAKARAKGVSLKTLQGDARRVNEQVNRYFDHILLMGPLYHLLQEEDRLQAIQASLSLLKPEGYFYASFIGVTAGIIYAMKYAPAVIMDENEKDFMDAFRYGNDFAGKGFTEAFMIQPDHILPLMEHFPLEKVHLFGQEGLMTHLEDNIRNQGEEVVNAWTALSEQVCESPHFLHYAEHLMYIGKKLIN